MSVNKDKPEYTEKNIKSIKVAIFCIVAVVIFYLGASFLKGINAFRHKIYYYAVFDNVGELHESATVALNGYPIGKVSGIVLMGTDPVKICARILITEDLDIPADSHFEVVKEDLLGGATLKMVMGSAKEKAHNGDTLRSFVAPGLLADIEGMKLQIQSVLASVDTIGLSIKSAFNLADSQNGAFMLKNTLINLEASTRHLNSMLAANEAKVGNIVTELNQLSNALGEATPQINAIIQNISNISDSIAQSNIRELIQNAQEAMANVNHVTAQLEKGEGTVGQLLQNDSLFNNLNNTSESLNALLKDLKEHPSRYINVTVFGGKKKNN